MANDEPMTLKQYLRSKAMHVGGGVYRSHPGGARVVLDLADEGDAPVLELTETPREAAARQVAAEAGARVKAALANRPNRWRH